MSDWTPSPWQVHHGELPSNYWRVAECGNGDDDEDVLVIAPIQDYCARAEDDACLIAASPDLYAAGQAIVGWCDANPPAGDALYCVQQMREALAKARGETP